METVFLILAIILVIAPVATVVLFLWYMFKPQFFRVHLFLNSVVTVVGSWAIIYGWLQLVVFLGKLGGIA